MKIINIRCHNYNGEIQGDFYGTVLTAAKKEKESSSSQIHGLETESMSITGVTHHTLKFI
jgi:hypothetical protein